MNGDLLGSVALPAAVAAAVTLIIEYAAKPWLEARKERILARHRALRQLRSAIRLLLTTLGSLGQRDGWYAGHVREALEKLEELYHEIKGLVPEVAFDLPPPIRLLLLRSVGRLHGRLAVLRDRDLTGLGSDDHLGELWDLLHEDLDAIQEQLTPATDYLLFDRMTPRQIYARWVLRRRAADLIDAMTDS